MKKKLSIFLSAVLLLALIIVPAQAADTVYNLIDEDGATWKDVEQIGNKATFEFKDNALIASADASYPYVQGDFNTPIEIDPSSDAVLNAKYKVEGNDGATSIQLLCGEETIAVHHFAGDDIEYLSSGDVPNGEYEYSVDISDLKMYDGNENNSYLGKKDLVLVDGKLVIDGVRVWCAGSTNIKVTVEKLEIVVPNSSDDNDDNDGDDSNDAQVANLAAGKGYTLFGLHKNEDGSVAYPDESGKDLTDGVFASSAVYNDEAFVGFNVKAPDMAEKGTNISEIVVDLESKESLTKFVLETLTESGPGIASPSEIKVYVSDDAESWSEVGTMEFDGDTSVDGIYKATLEKAVEGRYVKFASQHDKNWVFISEVEAYGYADSDDTGSGDENPQTSDYGFIGFALVAVVSLSGAILVSKKRFN